MTGEVGSVFTEDLRKRCYEQLHEPSHAAVDGDKTIKFIRDLADITHSYLQRGEDPHQAN